MPVESDTLNAQRRQTLAAKFKNLNLTEFERIYRKLYTRGGNDIEWKITAVKMARSGHYRIVDIARVLKKSPPNVGMALKRILDARPLRSAWRGGHYA